MNYYKVMLRTVDESGNEVRKIVDAQGGPLCVQWLATKK